MKKTIIATLFTLAASSSFAAVTGVPICTGATTAGKGASVPVNTFVVEAFTPNCSANVVLDIGEDGNSFAVCAGSTKGKTWFSGGSNGGAVSRSADCPSTGCPTTVPTTCLEDGLSKGASSSS